MCHSWPFSPQSPTQPSPSSLFCVPFFSFKVFFNIQSSRPCAWPSDGLLRQSCTCSTNLQGTVRPFIWIQAQVKYCFICSGDRIPPDGWMNVAAVKKATEQMHSKVLSARRRGRLCPADVGNTASIPLFRLLTSSAPPSLKQLPPNRPPRWPAARREHWMLWLQTRRVDVAVYSKAK